MTEFILVAVMFTGAPLEKPVEIGQCLFAEKIKAVAKARGTPPWIISLDTGGTIYVRDLYCKEAKPEPAAEPVS